MESLLPGLVKTARSLALSQQQQNLSPEEEQELDEYLLNQTKGIFGGGAGGDNPLAALMGSLTGGGGGVGGSGGGGGGGENPLAALMSGLGGLGGGAAASTPSSVHTHKGDIHENITVDLPDFFGNKEFSIKLHVKTFDPELNAVKKKKKRVVATLPAGSPEDFVLSIPNQGHYDSVTKTCGTLYIHFQMETNSPWKKLYRRQGSKLNVTLPMESFKSDGLSFRRTIPHPCGRNLTIVVDESLLQDAPLGVGGREFITIPGMGMPRNAAVSSGDNCLQIRVVMDLEKMEYIGGDFTIQTRYAIADSMYAFGVSRFGSASAVVNVTNPAWVHGRTSSPSSSAASSAAVTTAAAPRSSSVEEAAESDVESDDSDVEGDVDEGRGDALDIDE